MGISSLDSEEVNFRIAGVGSNFVVDAHRDWYATAYPTMRATFF